MKLFLIKIGKALNIIRQDGLIKGLTRIVRAFFGMFQKVGRGDILFITNGIGDSARYRTWNISEELKTHGLQASVTVQDNPMLFGYVDKFKIFVFHRTLFTARVKKMIEKIKQQGREIIFEADDLVFDPRYFKQMDYFKNMNMLEKKLYERGLGGEILNDQYVKVCTTTTSYLAKILESYGKKVFVVSNKLSNDDLKIIKSIRPKSLSSPSSLVKIGYFSGTKSHDRDFATITDALTQIMEKFSNARLVLVGPLDIKSKLNKFKNRIERLPFATRKRHFENISKININLAPLEISNPFCESKSELKFFEAGILKVPTVAAATQTFREAITDGVDGFLAGNKEEWIEKLEKLIMDKNLRESMGKKAREKVLQKYTIENSDNKEYYNYLRNRLTNMQRYG